MRSAFFAKETKPEQIIKNRTYEDLILMALQSGDIAPDDTLENQTLMSWCLKHRYFRLFECLRSFSLEKKAEPDAADKDIFQCMDLLYQAKSKLRWIKYREIDLEEVKTILLQTWKIDAAMFNQIVEKIVNDLLMGKLECVNYQAKYDLFQVFDTLPGVFLTEGMRGILDKLRVELELVEATRLVV